MSDSDWSIDDTYVDRQDLDASINRLLTARLTGRPRTRVTCRRCVPVRVPPRQRTRRPLSAVLYDAFMQGRAHEGEASAGGVSPSCPAEVQALFDELAAAVGTGKSAVSTVALLTSTFADPLNKALRDDFVAGRLTCAELVQADEFKLANPRQRAQVEESRREDMRQRDISNLKQLLMPITTLFTCPRCEHNECYANMRNTDFVKWQGDDPNPNLLECCKCGHTFKM